MNAAARLVQQKALSRHLVLAHVLTKQQIFIFVLALGVLFSALGVIYLTHTTRIVYSTYQQQFSERDRLQVEQSQLLLERSTLMMPARIQQMAEKKLDMVMPKNQSIVVIHE